MRNCRITQLQHAKGYDPAGAAAVFVGGSDARIIISPDQAALQRLWRESRPLEPHDLSGNLLVRLGLATTRPFRAFASALSASSAAVAETCPRPGAHGAN
jgi:hypothetical protein